MNNYFKITSLENDNEIKFNGQINLEYSLDGQTWIEYNTPIVLNANGYVMFKGNSRMSKYGDYVNVVASKKYKVSGDIMSLTSKDYVADYEFAYFFNDNTMLIDASELELPATTIANNCYYNMFNGCISLVNAPTTLPSITIPDEAYAYMFNGCISLVTAPTIMANEFQGRYGCIGMFNGCAKLNHLKVMFNDWGYDTTCGWTQGVMDSGTFVCPSILEDKRGNDYIPLNWTRTI